MTECLLLAFLALMGLFVLTMEEDEPIVPYSDASGDYAYHGSFCLKRQGLPDYNSSTKILIRNVATGIDGMSTSRATLYLQKHLVYAEIDLQSGLNTRIDASSGNIVFTGETHPSSFMFISNRTCDLGQVTLHLVDSTISTSIRSDACNFSISINASSRNIASSSRKVSRFSFMYNLGLVFQWRQIAALLSDISLNGVGLRVEPWCLILQQLVDTFEMLALLTMGVSGQYALSTFACLALFKLMLFGVLQTSLTIRVWNAHHPVDSVETGNRNLRNLYLRIYSALFTATFLSGLYFEYLQLTVTLYQLYWLPQIIYDIKRGSRNPFTVKYLVITALTRLWLPLYLWGATDSFLDSKLYLSAPDSPAIGFAVFLLLLQAAQVCLMISQKRWGPRWFVPWILLPNVYNYYRNVPNDPEHGDAIECVICMGVIEAKDGDRSAVTPCSHVFHSTCLDQWLDIKLECPTCRRELPPFSN